MNLETSLNISEAIITYSCDNGILAFNKNAEMILYDAFSTQIYKGIKLTEIFGTAYKDELYPIFQSCKNGKSGRIYLKQDHHTYIFNFSPILNEEGTINKVSILIDSFQDSALEFGKRNSDNECESEKELYYNNQVYSNLFYNNPDPVFSLDLEGNFVKANQSAADMVETSSDELLKMHFLPLVIEEDRRNALDHFQKAAKGESQKYHINFKSVKGTRKFLEINNFPITHKNKIIGVYGIAKDITRQNNAEKKIMEERQMLRAIIDNIPDYIFVKDRAHKSILANRKFYNQILGKDSDESNTGYTPMDYFDTDKGEEIIADNELVMNSGEPVINRPDTVLNIFGKKEKVLLTKVPLKNQKEEIIGLVGIARDITETYLNNKKQALVLRVIKAFGDKPTFQDAMTKVLKIFCEELNFDFAESYKVSFNNEKLIRSAFWSKDKEVAEEKVKFKIGDGLPGKIWELGEIQIIRENETTQPLNELAFIGTKNLRTMVGFPIEFEEKLISIICLGSKLENKEVEFKFLEDLTLQIASAIERKRSQEQLNNFFQFSPNLIAVLGLDGFVKKINPSFVELFGYSEDEILSKPFTEFVHPDDLQRAFEAVEIFTVEESDFEIRLKKKDGEYLWISWRFSQFFREDNVVFTYGTDITPLKKIHSELTEHIELRHFTQQKLEESEKNYRSLFNGSPLPMWVLDNQTLKFLKVNQAALDLYGYTEEEFSEMTVRDLWAPDQEKLINPIIETNKNDFFQVKVRHFKKNGELIYVNVNSNPVNFDGRTARVSLIKNVTDRIIAEEKLLHREQRFKALVQDGSDLISIVDCGYNYVYNSPATKSVFGLEPNLVNGTNFRDYIHKDDLANINVHLEKLKVQKRVQLPSYRVKGIEKNWRWIETIVTNLRNEPAIEGIVMNSRDITEFVEQEQELIASLKRYDIVSKATSDIITDYSIAENVISVSEATFKMFGYANEGGVYTSEWWESKIHPEDFDNVRAAANEMISNKIKNLTIEYRFKCADDSYKYILDRSYLMSDEEGNPQRIIGSLQDITERKIHLIAIENHNKRLKEIAWTQSHLVRAPLAKVMGLVDLLLNYKDDLDNTDELLENVLNSANQLDAIIRKIADQSESEL